jgi:two-component system LytT family response regulator
LIVDDEAPARAKLRLYLEADERAVVVGEATNGLEAVERVESLRPELVLLDVQMPGLDGFEVLAALQDGELPHVVFVTAHDEHAVRAFEVRALDYLLKPVDRGRLRSAVDRVIEAGRPGRDALRVLEDRPTATSPLERFLVRERGRLRLVPVGDVDWIGAAGNYVELHVGDHTHLVRGTLNELESRLPERRFARVHRSTIVNLDRVRELQPWSHGDLLLVLHGGTELRLSRRYRDRIQGVFGG